MTRQRARIGLLVDTLAAEYTTLVWRAVKRAASARGVDTLTFTGLRIESSVVAEATQNRIYELVGRANVDGVVVLSSVLAHFCGPEGIAALGQRLAPLPLCSVGLEVPGMPSLVVDNEGGMALGTEHLLDVHERRRIAFIAAQRMSGESQLRLAGFRRAHQARGLACDERLIEHADFTMAGGAAAMRRVIERGVPLDAVVAANDYMALGAIDVLREHGLRVPGDVLVSGFDDISIAPCARPSLSTLRQPIWWLAEAAVTTLLQQIAGEPVPPRQAGQIELVRRESCGCGFQEVPTQRPTGPVMASLREGLRRTRDSLEQKLVASVFVPNHALGDWQGVLLEALDAELAGEEGCFASTFEQYLDRALQVGVVLDEFQRMITTLRAEVRRFPIAEIEEHLRVERLWHTLRIMVGTASVRSVGRDRLEIVDATLMLGDAGERFATTLSLPLLRDAMVAELPRLQIDEAAVSLRERSGGGQLVPFLVLRDGAAQTVDPSPFPPAQLMPEGAFSRGEVVHAVVMPLTFEAEFLGVAVFGAGAVPGVYVSLRAQIGAAIKGAALHREAMAHAAVRERLEQERVREETRVAAEIQSSMAPSNLAVPNLELAHVTLPAAEAGGDYCDVLPDAGGAWLTIGDVSGHGLGSGLIMLMLQSISAGIVRSDAQIAPSRLVVAVNGTLFDNVRHRLHRDDHATLTVIRYEPSGRLRFAGLHEPLLVVRAATGRCEAITPPGFWVGALPEIAHLTEDAELTLEEGDLLVLHTDGVTEARNAQQEQFGLERLTVLLEAQGDRPSAAIRDAILAAVHDWCSVLDDDVTLLIARYRAR